MGLDCPAVRFGRVGAVVDPARDVLKLRQVTVRPPHFVLVVRGQAKPVAPGQNNLFAAIVLFVHMVATNHLGRLLYAPRPRCVGARALGGVLTMKGAQVWYGPLQ